MPKAQYYSFTNFCMDITNFWIWLHLSLNTYFNTKKVYRLWFAKWRKFYIFRHRINIILTKEFIINDRSRTNVIADMTNGYHSLFPNFMSLGWSISEHHLSSSWTMAEMTRSSLTTSSWSPLPRTSWWGWSAVSWLWHRRHNKL